MSNFNKYDDLGVLDPDGCFITVDELFAFIKHEHEASEPMKFGSDVEQGYDMGMQSAFESIARMLGKKLGA